jgi:hypothetical protein
MCCYVDVLDGLVSLLIRTHFLSFRHVCVTVLVMFSGMLDYSKVYLKYRLHMCGVCTCEREMCVGH